LALSDSELFSNNVNTGDQFSDGMFDLNPSVHLQEKEFSRWSKKEFNRPGSDVIDGFCCSNRCLPHSFSQLVGHGGSRRFFEHLLMATLNAAFPFTKVYGPTVSVRQHLDLNVFRARKQALNVDSAIAERSHGFSSCTSRCLFELAWFVNSAHAFSSSAAGGFEQERVAHSNGSLVECSHRGRFIGIVNLFARNHWDASMPHGLPSGHFVAHLFNGLWRWPNPDEVCCGDRTGEFSPFRKKSESGMNGCGSRIVGCLNDLGLIEVGFGDGVANEHDHFICQFREQAAVVIGRTYRHRWEACLGARTEDSASDFPTVSDQDFDAVPLLYCLGFQLGGRFSRNEDNPS
jgi:hypothetical protein